MPTFKTYMRILLAHRIYIVIYLVIISITGIAIGLSTASGSSQHFTATSSRVAIIDHDDSRLSRALSAHVAKGNTVVPLADNKKSVQDALAQDTVSYLLVIPKGWGHDLMVAAVNEGTAPALEASVSYRSGEGFLVDQEVRSYAQGLFGSASLGGSQSDVVHATDESWGKSIGVSTIGQRATPLPDSLLNSALFSSYPIFASVTVCIALLMKTLNAKALHGRRVASPQSPRERNMALVAACVCIALVAWAWNFGLQTAILGRSAITQSPAQLGIVGLALLAYSLVSASVGFLVGQLGFSENAANAVANIEPVPATGRTCGRRPLHTVLLGVPRHRGCVGHEGRFHLERAATRGMRRRLHAVWHSHTACWHCARTRPDQAAGIEFNANSADARAWRLLAMLRSFSRSRLYALSFLGHSQCVAA